jgi:hypothetical protein
MNSLTLFLTAGFLFFFWLGYKFGRRTEKWAQNQGNGKKELLHQEESNGEINR